LPQVSQLDQPHPVRKPAARQGQQPQREPALPDPPWAAQGENPARGYELAQLIELTLPADEAVRFLRQIGLNPGYPISARHNRPFTINPEQASRPAEEIPINPRNQFQARYLSTITRTTGAWVCPAHGVPAAQSPTALYEASMNAVTAIIDQA
jgi:hypothetical protein